MVPGRRWSACASGLPRVGGRAERERILDVDRKQASSCPFARPRFLVSSSLKSRALVVVFVVCSRESIFPQTRSAQACAPFLPFLEPFCCCSNTADHSWHALLLPPLIARETPAPRDTTLVRQRQSGDTRVHHDHDAAPAAAADSRGSRAREARGSSICPLCCRHAIDLMCIHLSGLSSFSSFDSIHAPQINRPSFVMGRPGGV